MPAHLSHPEAAVEHPASTSSWAPVPGLIIPEVLHTYKKLQKKIPKLLNMTSSHGGKPYTYLK